MVVRAGRCGRGAGQVKLSYKSTKEGKMSMKSRDLSVHKNYVETYTGLWCWWQGIDALPKLWAHLCKSCTLKPFCVISAFNFSLLEGRHYKSNGDFSTVIFFCFFAFHLWGVQLPCCTLDKLLLLKHTGYLRVMLENVKRILPLHKTVYTSVRVTKSIFCFSFKQVVSNTFEKKELLVIRLKNPHFLRWVS